MAEMARLESVCTLTGYRGFESLSLRKKELRTARPFLLRKTGVEPWFEIEFIDLK